MNLAGRLGYGCWFWSILPALGIAFIILIPFTFIFPKAIPTLFIANLAACILIGRFFPFPPVRDEYEKRVLETKQE